MAFLGIWLFWLALGAHVSLETHLGAALAYYAIGVTLSLLAQRPMRPPVRLQLKLISATLFGIGWLVHVICVLLLNWQPHLRQLSILRSIYK